MAEEPINQRIGGGKAGMAASSHEGHLIQLEGRVGHLERDVTEIKGGIRALLDRPANAGFNQMLTTGATVLVICGFIFGFGEWRLRQAVDPVVEKAHALEISDSEQKLQIAVIQERMAWMRATAAQSNTISKSDRQ